jgi:hypothetical protein
MFLNKFFASVLRRQAAAPVPAACYDDCSELYLLFAAVVELLTLSRSTQAMPRSKSNRLERHHQYVMQIALSAYFSATAKFVSKPTMETTAA